MLSTYRVAVSTSQWEARAEASLYRLSLYLPSTSFSRRPSYSDSDQAA